MAVRPTMWGPRVTEAALAEREAMLGLNQPVFIQYLSWLKELLQGNMGFSFRQYLPVSQLIGQYIGPTALLMGISLSIAMLISIPAGILSAVKQYSFIDYGIVLSSFIGTSVPSFFLALVLIYVFNIQLGVLPSSGMRTLGMPNNLVDLLRHMVMPVTVMVVSVVGTNIRYIRASMLEILEQNYLRTARSKGIGKGMVIFKHAFRNALLPIVTVLGMQIPLMFSGSVVIEQVFSYPGLGRLTMTAILNRDFPLIMGVSLLAAVIVVLSNLITDILYVLVDPNIEYE